MITKQEIEIPVRAVKGYKGLRNFQGIADFDFTHDSFEVLGDGDKQGYRPNQVEIVNFAHDQHPKARLQTIAQAVIARLAGLPNAECYQRGREIVMHSEVSTDTYEMRVGYLPSREADLLIAQRGLAANQAGELLIVTSDDGELADMIETAWVDAKDRAMPVPEKNEIVLTTAAKKGVSPFGNYGGTQILIGNSELAEAYSANRAEKGRPVQRVWSYTPASLKQSKLKKGKLISLAGLGSDGFYDGLNAYDRFNKDAASRGVVQSALETSTGS